MGDSYENLVREATPWTNSLKIKKVSFIAPREYSKHVNDVVNVSMPPAGEGLCSWH